MNRRMLGLTLEITVPLLVLVAWGVWSSAAGNFYFPPLLEILQVFRENWLFARFPTDVLPSLTRMFTGFGIAVVSAVILGMILGLSQWARRAANPVLEFMRAIPAPALIPFGIVVLGVGDLMKVFLIALVCFFPVLLNTVDGVKGVDPTLVETSAMYGIGRARRLSRVVLPAALPQIFAGIRTSLSLAIIMMVVSEMVAATNGVGYFLVQSQRAFDLPGMWSGILLLGVLGYVLNLLFVLIEHRVLRWHRGARGNETN